VHAATSALALAAAHSLAAEPADAVPQHLHVSIEDGLLAVDLGEVELIEVLHAISEQAGIEVRVRGAPGMIAPQAFHGLPLAQGLRRLVGRHSILMTFRASAEGGSASMPELVRVYSATSGGRADAVVAFVPPPPPTAPAPPVGERLTAVRALASERQLIEVLRSEPEATVRRAAVTSLAAIGSRHALEGILLALGDDHRSVRVRAIEAVARLADDARSLARVEAAVARLPDERTRTAVIRALQRAEDEEAELSPDL
jgi:hypothetical protein